MLKIIETEKIKLLGSENSGKICGYLHTLSNGIKYFSTKKDWLKGEIYHKPEYRNRVTLSKYILLILHKKSCDFILHEFQNYLGKKGNNIFILSDIIDYLKVKENISRDNLVNSLLSS